MLPRKTAFLPRAKWVYLLVLTIQTAVLSAQTKPNVIVVFADDLGIGDVSEYRRKQSNTILVETPVVDELIRNGMHFTDGHSPTALCAPSRYALMTGRNNYRSRSIRGVWNSYQQGAIAPGDLTLGKVMQ
ncbi:MAG: sulfatase-like hydrolase/transferase, partial [Bacteroidota bacterium]